MSKPSLSRRFLSFGSLPFLASVAPLFVLPAVAHAVAPDVWVSLLTAQAVGSIAGLLILSGWAVHGQARVALAGADDGMRRGLYSASIRSRTRSALVVLPAAVVLFNAVLSPREPVLGTLMLMSTAWSGFSMSWYAIGSARPSWVALYEFLPKIAGNIVAIPLITATGAVWTYPIVLIAATSLGLCAFHTRELGVLLPNFPLDADTHERAERIRAATVSVLAASYASAPLPMASGLGIAGMPGLASADRLYRYALYSITTLANTLQEWVLGARGAERHRRQVTALRLHLALGVAGAAGIAALGPLGGRILFGADVAPTRATCFGYALAFGFVSCSTPLVRNILVPARRTGVVLSAVSISLLIGLSGIWIGATALGASGVAVAAGATELVNLVLLAVRARPVLLASGAADADLLEAAGPGAGTTVPTRGNGARR